MNVVNVAKIVCLNQSLISHHFEICKNVRKRIIENTDQIMLESIASRALNCSALKNKRELSSCAENAEL